MVDISKSPVMLVYEKLEQKGLSRDSLKRHGLFIENINEMSWETAVKLSNLLGETPTFWMSSHWNYRKK